METCERCGRPARITTMSFFDTSTICLSCESREERHPRHRAAVEADEQAIKRGDFNYPGIGLPSDMKGGTERDLERDTDTALHEDLLGEELKQGPRHPEVRVPMVGEDGNAFAVLGRVMKAMRRAGVPKEEIERFSEEARAGDYNNLLATVMRWVEVD